MTSGSLLFIVCSLACIVWSHRHRDFPKSGARRDGAALYHRRHSGAVSSSLSAQFPRRGSAHRLTRGRWLGLFVFVLMLLGRRRSRGAAKTRRRDAAKIVSDVMLGDHGPRVMNRVRACTRIRSPVSPRHAEHGTVRRSEAVLHRTAFVPFEMATRAPQ